MNMNEVQLMECGYRHLEIELFNAAVKTEEDGGFSVALRNEEWVCDDGMARGYWVKVDDFRLIRGIRAELFVDLRDRFAERLKDELPLDCEWMNFILRPKDEQLLVIAEHFHEAFLWDCQENPFPLESLPQPQALADGNLDYSETQDFLRSRNRNQWKRDFTAVIRDNWTEFDESERILGELWGFDPDESYYGNSSKFEVEEITFKDNPQKASRTVVLKLGKAPNGFYAVGVSLNLDRSGGGYAPHVWNPVGYMSRDEALLGAVETVREWLDRSDDNPKTIDRAKKWLDAQEAQVMQLSLF